MKSEYASTNDKNRGRNQRCDQSTFTDVAKDDEIQRRDSQQDIACVDHVGNDDEEEKDCREPQHEKCFAVVFPSTDKTLSPRGKRNQNREAG